MRYHLIADTQSAVNELSHNESFPLNDAATSYLTGLLGDPALIDHGRHVWYGRVVCEIAGASVLLCAFTLSVDAHGNAAVSSWVRKDVTFEPIAAALAQTLADEPVLIAIAC